jgi:hypothetical protein
MNDAFQTEISPAVVIPDFGRKQAAWKLLWITARVFVALKLFNEETVE